MDLNVLDEGAMHVDSEYENEKSDVAIITPQSLEEEAVKDDRPSADNYEQMKQVVFPPLLEEYEVLDEAVFTWEVSDWRKLPNKLHSEAFQCGGYPWKILLFPFGNNAEYVSIYLEHGFDDAPPENWYSCVQFALVVWNPKEPKNNHYLHAHHRFTKEDGDWGFTRFQELRKIFQRQEKNERPIIEDDSTNISAYVRVIKDPTGVLWHNFLNYDSKKETGYVGMKNQGATCYLNSLLQSLYFTNSFRKAVFQIPTEGEPVTNSAFALQRLFYRLQNDKDAVDTAELTRSFGWDAKIIFDQQDVQELCRKLMEALEEKMKGTKAENALADMFVGKMRTYIECINVNYTSARVEDFWDIQLNVRGQKNLEDSFRDYIAVETLEGENKYFAEGHGLQDARKGVIFESFPKVLHLHLKRFEYDFMRDDMMKVNDRYEFPSEFDAAPYLAPEADKSEPWIYTLHGVLVHSGDFNAGHYYAYLKPEKDGPFFKFDDERVIRAMKHEVLDDNFGGDTIINGVPRQEPPRLAMFKRSTSAYMLVYYRKSRIEEVLPEILPADTPAHIEARFEEERAFREAKRKEKEEQHLYLHVKVASDPQFRAHQGFDLAVLDEKNPHREAAPVNYKMLKTATIEDLTRQVAENLGAEPENLRLWVMVNRQNRTVRPDQPLMEKTMTIEEAANRYSNKNADFRLWAENQSVLMESPTVKDVRVLNTNTILLFLKFFDVEKQTLEGAGCIYMRKQDKVSDLIPALQRRSGLKTPLTLYEEIKPNMIEPMKPKQTFQQAEIQNGDIICFQQELSPQQVADLRSKDRFGDARDLYEYLINKITITFIPKNKAENAETFELDLNRKIVYDQLAAKVGEHLNVPPTHIRFTTVTTNGVPRIAVKRSDQTLAQILASQYITSTAMTTGTLLYEVLDLSLSELETKRNVKLVWLPDGISKEEPMEFLLPKQSQVQDLLEPLKAKLNIEDLDFSKIRFFESSSGKLHKLVGPDHPIISIGDTGSMRFFVEKIPEEELQPMEDVEPIPAFHFHKEPSRPHLSGVPFQFMVKHGEIFKETRNRLQKRTGIKGKQFEKIKFAVVFRAAFSKPRYLEDDDILSEIIQPGDLLGLDHTEKKSSSWRTEQSIFIR